MADRICKWGILGTANIARKNWQSIRLAENATLTAVASRTPARAEEFIADCQAHVPFDPPPAAVGSYEELLSRDDVDAIYIPLPTMLRKPWVIRAAEAGKHVLCEKPCGATVADLEEMVAVCREHNVQFMDGVMFMHSQRLGLLRDVLNDGRSVGDLRRIATQFSFCAPEEFLEGNIRMSSELEPLGCLGDLGWYNIRFTLWTMNEQLPERVSGRLLKAIGRDDSPEPVPVEFSGELFFDGGVSASFYCSFITENQQWANLSGSKGNIQVDDFVLPFFGCEIGFHVRNAAFEITGCDFNMEDHGRHFAVREYSNSAANAQETNLFREFSKLAVSGQPDEHWPEIAVKTQRVLQACLQSSREGGAVISLS